MIEIGFFMRGASQLYFARKPLEVLTLRRGLYHVGELDKINAGLQLPVFLDPDTSLSVDYNSQTHSGRVILAGTMSSNIELNIGRGIIARSLDGLLSVSNRRSVVFVECDQSFSQPHSGTIRGTRKLRIKSL